MSAMLIPQPTGLLTFKNLVNLGALFSLAFLIILPNGLNAQDGVLRTLSVKGTIMVQEVDGLKPLQETVLEVSEVGHVTTGEKGQFAFNFPLKEERLFNGADEIWFTLSDYEMIRPYKGILQIDTLDYNLVLDLLVLPKNAQTNYSVAVKKLNNRLEKLQRDNALSTARLNALNDSLLTNLQRNEAQKQALQNTISALESDLQTTSANNDALNAKLATAKSDLQELQTSLEATNLQLEKALEEKYLRQQAFFKTITEDLKDFLIRTKDVHELFLDIGNYFPSSNTPGFVGTYNEGLKAYSKVIEKINEERDNNVKGVNRYWQDPQIAKQLDRTYEVVFDLIHYPKLQPAVREINNLIRSNKKKKAISAGKAAFESLTAPIINLEKMINRVIADLEATE